MSFCFAVLGDRAGELGDWAPPTLILNTLLGGLLNHVLATPESCGRR
ncbi:hypothetical protein [Nonomuraea sp. NPDC049141]